MNIKNKFFIFKKYTKKINNLFHLFNNIISYDVIKINKFKNIKNIYCKK